MQRAIRRAALRVFFLGTVVFVPQLVRGDAPAQGTIVGWGWQPEEPPHDAGFVSVAAGNDGGVGLKADGSTVEWWRYNPNYQVDLSDNSGFVAIAAGTHFYAGLKASGSIVGWGRADEGRLYLLPNSGFVAVSAFDHHSLGLKTDGSIVAWGCAGWDFDAGQCNVPPPNSGYVAVAAGSYHSLGLKADGTVVAWGFNGGLTDVPSPNSDFVAIAAGSFQSLGLKADGSAVAWGCNGTYDRGQCDVPLPATGFVAVAAGPSHSLGLKAEPNGDFDIDADVQLDDVGVFTMCQFGPGAIPTPRAPLTTMRCIGAFDIMRDGRIDLVDAAQIQLRFAPP